MATILHGLGRITPRGSNVLARRASGVVAAVTLSMLASSAWAQAPTPAPTPPPTGSPTAGSVTISLAEYNALLDRIATGAVRPGPAPVPAIVARAEIALRLDGDLARATITLYGEVLRAGPTAVPLFSGGTLLDARVNGHTVPLMPHQDKPAAVLPGRGPFTMTVAWAAPVVNQPGRASIVLPALAAGSVRASIDAPGEGSDLRLEPAVVTRRAAANGRTTVEATLTPAAATRLTWSSRDVSPSAPARTLRLLSDVKTLVTIGEGDVRVAALFDVSIVQGTTSTLEVRLPAGFELASASGPTVAVASERPGVLVLSLVEAERRRHQFLVSLERATPDATARHEIALPWLEGSQRETGEVTVEGVGALELQVEDRAPLTRIDVGEVGASLQALAREPLLAAYRYQRRSPTPVSIGLDARRFPDAPVLSAIAERAVATTLVTAEGRALTEITLTMRNQAQPFLKVGLPQGAELLSAEVAGVGVKPAQGADGVRVPLLRPGFQARGPYTVSFVYLHTGAAFGRKGDAQMSLARLDVPVTWLEWELFLPDRFEVSRFDGQAFAQALVEPRIEVTTGLSESVTVMTEASPDRRDDRKEKDPSSPPIGNEPSLNVQSLQRRAAGILPVRIDVPRAGRSHTFVRPLVLDEPTTLAFRYRSR